MTPAPHVSVLIAAYQSEAFVGRAISSALGQTLQDIEVIVVDDGSRDGTWDVIQSIARGDPRLVALRHQKNQGAASARNTALAAARGQWLAILDADDEFLATRLETMCDAASKSGADLVADNLILRDAESGSELGLAFPPEAMAHRNITLPDLLRGEEPGTDAGLEFGFMQPLIRRAFIEKHNIRYAENLTVGEDFALYAECLIEGACYATIPEALYIYNVRPHSASTSEAALESMRAANRRVQRLFAEAGATDELTRQLLEDRQKRLDLAALAGCVRAGHVGRACTILLDLPPLYLLGHIYGALWMKPNRRKHRPAISLPRRA